MNCGFSALEQEATFAFLMPASLLGAMERVMKKIAVAVALVVAALSLGGCFVGKGKAPAPVITKG